MPSKCRVHTIRMQAARSRSACIIVSVWHNRIMSWCRMEGSSERVMACCIIMTLPVSLVNGTADIVFQLSPVVETNDSDRNVRRISACDWLKLQPFALQYLRTFVHLEHIYFSRNGVFIWQRYISFSASSFIRIEKLITLRSSRWKVRKEFSRTETLVN